ncbi:MAG: alpha/beta fold hydrolase [Thermoplasmata archaeon]|nr:alpha/beta fold hydrolase [Thermoplasmata archaeon]
MTPEDAARTARLRSWFDVATSYSPEPTHDGTSVAYLSDPGERPQAFRVPIDGGRSIPLTPDGQRIGAIHPSPTDGSAVVALDSGGNEHWQLALLSDMSQGRPTIRSLTNDPDVIHSPGRWREDGKRYAFSSNARDRRFFDVYELEVGREGATPVPVLTADGLHDVVDARAGQLLIAHARTNLDVDLILRQGERTLTLNPHEGEETVRAATVTSEAVYAGANPGREFAALVRYRPGRPGHEFLREYLGDVELVEASPDGRQLLVGVNRDGWSELHLFSPATGEDRPLPTSPKGVVAKARWTPDGSAIVHDLSSVEGVEVYRRFVESGKPRRLTNSPRPVPVHVRDPKLERAVAVDRVVLPYWQYEPAGAAVGTLIEVHGGPESQARPGLNRFRQFLVAEGWRVVLPNVRGSTGYGRTFVHLDDVRKRMDSVRDLRDLVAHVRKRDGASVGPIGILGGSYGGFMVLSALSTYPDLFSAGVDIVGIANFVTFLEKTGPWRRAVREAEYGTLDHDRDFLEEISPLGHADRITAPLLVIHGRNDPRVPAHEAEQIVETLRTLGRTVDLLMFDDEGHGIVGRTNRERAYGAVAAFLAQHVGRAASSAPP